MIENPDLEYLRTRGEPSPELQLGPIPESPIQESIRGVITDLKIVEAIIFLVGIDHLPTIIDMLTDRLAREAAIKAEDDGRCTESSWRAKNSMKYGPGGYNRCVLIGAHEEHEDGFGNIFVLKPSFRVTGHKKRREELWMAYCFSCFGYWAT